MSSRASRSWIWAPLVGLLLVVGCSDDSGVDAIVAPQFGKGGGGGGPTVEAADPPEAAQNITLDVRVIGSGFDNGSEVRFLLAGQSTPKILTNHSTFVDRNTMIANITIAEDADLALYDIEVMSLRGKKGIGSELFRVKDPADGGPSYQLSFFPNPDAAIGDISDTDVVVGSVNGQPALTDLSGNVATWLPDLGHQDIGAYGVSPNAGYVVGEYYDASVGQRAVVWSVGGGSPSAVEPAQPAGFPYASYWLQLYQINDAGVAVGQLASTDAPLQYPVVARPDGAGGWTSELLPLLPGHTEGIAFTINESGIIVGVTQTGAPHSRHGVVWFPNGDGTYDLLDLTPGADGTGDILATAATEVAGDGTMLAAGGTYYAGDGALTAWLIDVGSRSLLTETRSSGAGFFAQGISSDGRVLTSSQVWNPTDDTTIDLQEPGAGCSYGGRVFDSAGQVYGSAEINTKNASDGCSQVGKWTEDRPAVWTLVGG